MRKLPLVFLLLCIAVFISNCREKEKIKIDAADVFHQNQHELTKVIIYDVFTPPVASRIYAYTSLAQYEAIRFSDSSGHPSIIDQLNGFSKLPQPEAGKQYDFTLAATQAFFTVARKVTFSVDSFIAYENKIFSAFKNNLDDAVYERSVRFGKHIAQTILARAASDNYSQTRGKPKFLGSNDPGKWRPTPPDYFDGVEYCWGTMKTFVLDSSSQFRPALPPPYNEDTSSSFYKATLEVYRINKNLTDEEKEVARYWDDNPFVMEHSGHMIFANKKITPGGHWMGITEIACKKTQADAVKTAQAYALAAIAMFDSFISCWQEKYLWNVIRPVSVINEKIDANWVPYLQTPPFPEYPSGHSAISMAAAAVLTHIFGDNFSFTDTSDLAYIGMKRKFTSFFQAANEVSVSRVYGGIHYMYSVNAGADQGRMVAVHILQKLKL